MECIDLGHCWISHCEWARNMKNLRYALLNCCLPLIKNEPTFAAYYAKKRAEGKPHRVAMTHVAKKLLRVIYTLQTKNIPYNADLVR